MTITLNLPRVICRILYAKSDLMPEKITSDFTSRRLPQPLKREISPFLEYSDSFLCLGAMFIVRGAFGSLLNRIKTPALLGYMPMGIIMGNLGLMNDQILDVSGELRKIALTIILLKAGLSLEVDDLRRVRRPAVLLSLLPCCMEMGAIGVAGHFILGPALVGSFLLGAVLGAVSPAVVVPRTTAMLDGEMGTRHGVPQMIIAGSSMDDIVMIVFYSSFLSMEGGGGISAKAFMNIPIPIATGILVVVLAGVAFPFIFKKALIKEPMKVVFLLGSCLVMVF